MRVSFSSNIKAEAIRNENTNNIKLPQQKKQAEPEVNFSKNSFNESLVRTLCPSHFDEGFHIIKGFVNGSRVFLQEKPQKQDIQKNAILYKGLIGEQEAEIKLQKNEVLGKVGDKEFNLLFKSNIFGKFSITGNIGEKQINISKGSSVDEAKGENDILTVILSLKGAKMTVKNGKFGKMALSQQSQNDQFDMMVQHNVMQRQMLQNQTGINCHTRFNDEVIQNQIFFNL